MEFVSFEIAKKLKEKGFREKCFGYYAYYGDVIYYHIIQDPVPSRQLTFKDFKDCKNVYKEIEKYDAPTISQVMKWLRDEKKIHIGVLYHNYYAVWIQPMKHNEAEHVIHDCKTHEEAELEGIEFVINNLI